jgi:transposase InsO family protein
MGTCKFFSISRQSYYQHEWRLSKDVLDFGLLLDEVKEIRKRHTRLGTRKLYAMLRSFMDKNSIKLGRDGLFDLLSSEGLLIRRRKRRARTTFSFHWLKKYPNLIIDFVPVRPNQLWVCDITYWKIEEISLYISFITDAYSRRIAGFHLSENLYAEETMKALNMALFQLKKDKIQFDGLIHHSDRGVQYCSYSYVNLLKNSNINISMTQSGDPLENALAERVNGIIKEEYLINCQYTTLEDARKQLAQAVWLYNNERPHSSIGNFTPEYVHYHHEQIPKEKIKQLWKNYYTKEGA